MFSARYYLRTATGEHGRETRSERKGGKNVQDFADHREKRLPPSKLGLVVPTGFEPVFKP